MRHLSAEAGGSPCREFARYPDRPVPGGPSKHVIMHAPCDLLRAVRSCRSLACLRRSSPGVRHACRAHEARMHALMFRSHTACPHAQPVCRPAVLERVAFSQVRSTLIFRSLCLHSCIPASETHACIHCPRVDAHPCMQASRCRAHRFIPVCVRSMTHDECIHAHRSHDTCMNACMHAELTPDCMRSESHA